MKAIPSNETRLKRSVREETGDERITSTAHTAASRASAEIAGISCVRRSAPLGPLRRKKPARTSLPRPVKAFL